ncbi:MAG: SGNH/GDSL hydrolase family protein [Burkholderiales bacterium]
MVVQIIKPVLAPVLLAQARRLRRRALDLPEPEGPRSGVAKFASGTQSAETPLTLLIAGDSSAAGVGAPTQEAALAPQLAAALAARVRRDVAWHLYAHTGLTSAGVLNLLKESTLPPADLGVIIVGVNDIANDVAVGHALRVRNRIVRLLQTRTGVGHILFPGLPAVERFPLLPQPLAWYGGAEARRNNQLQSRWARHRKRAGLVSHVPMDGFTHPQLMAEDGYHPSPVLYAMVAAHLADHLSLRVAAPDAERQTAANLMGSAVQAEQETLVA